MNVDFCGDVEADLRMWEPSQPVRFTTQNPDGTARDITGNTLVAWAAKVSDVDGSSRVDGVITDPDFANGTCLVQWPVQSGTWVLYLEERIGGDPASVYTHLAAKVLVRKKWGRPT